ncbi:trypsin-like serine peptidase [Sphaerimonospora sp. CA-214678]|uniref:trypsin-like serine peptidase n=1 Tax=Sphaerimonospora sp. CA-214678 TaxID=3240029 RepID=UPI003D942C8A
MKRTLAFGGVVATAGLLAAGLAATPAQAADKPAAVNLANTNLAAQQVAAFWYGEAKANLIQATPYAVETTVPAKHVSGGGPAADTKPGVVPAIGDEKKTASKSKNVNLPKTSGKVFFIGADNKPHWCSATSVQSQYRNLVATAGHCVYDTESNKATLDKWVFIPGYYQGKTPWGIYVGKQAFTHYDFDVYEDGDRNYAFVTVYNGVLPTTERPTSGKDYGYKSGLFRTEREAKIHLAKLKADKSTVWSALKIVKVEDKGGRHGHNRGKNRYEYKNVPAKVQEVQSRNRHADLTSGDVQLRNGYKAGEITEISAREYGYGNRNKDSYVSQDGLTLFFKKTVEEKVKGKFGKETTKQVTKYYKRTFTKTEKVKATPPPAKKTYKYQVVGAKLTIGLKDVGRLGDNVGGQGLAYNQKVGSNVFVFGYPSGSHPDGNYAFSGKTLKWAYGKTFAATAPAIKGEELLGVKSSFTGEGSIGSSWLLKYQSAKRIGYLNGVTIAVADRDGNKRIDTSLSPYFDGETYGVYQAAAKSWSGKIV